MIMAEILRALRAYLYRCDHILSRSRWSYIVLFHHDPHRFAFLQRTMDIHVHYLMR